MSKKNKREFKARNPHAKLLNEERHGAFKLRKVHPKKLQKPKKITMADVRKGKLDEDDE